MIRPVRPVHLREHLRTVWLACLILPALGFGTAASTTDTPAFPARIAAAFDPARHETLIRGDIAADSCLTFRLPDEWRLSQGDQGSFVLAAESGAEIALRLRSAVDLKGLPHPDQAGRNAVALQQEYEEAIGKPVQAVSHETTGHAGVTRWSATWIDGNVANASHAFTVEALIVAITDDSTLELTFTGSWGPEVLPFEASLLPSLRVVKGSDCQQRTLAAW